MEGGKGVRRKGREKGEEGRVRGVEESREEEERNGGSRKGKWREEGRVRGREDRREESGCSFFHCVFLLLFYYVCFHCC